MSKHVKDVKELDFNGYKYIQDQKQVERMAHAFDWAAKDSPMQFVAYNLMLKAVTGQASMPRLKSKEVDLLRSRMSRVRKILRVKYGRGLITSEGRGARATVDNEDQLKTDVRRATEKYVSAGQRLVNAVSMVDIAKVPVTEENKVIHQWYRGALKQQVAMISAPDYLRKLLPPLPSKESKENEESAEEQPKPKPKSAVG